jgi:hypothetical protein
MSRKELRDMIDALESAIRTGDALVIGLTVGQVLESMKKIHDRNDRIITTNGPERMRINPGVNPGVWPQGDTMLKMGDTEVKTVHAPL